MSQQQEQQITGDVSPISVSALLGSTEEEEEEEEALTSETD